MQIHIYIACIYQLEGIISAIVHIDGKIKMKWKFIDSEMSKIKVFYDKNLVICILLGIFITLLVF